MKTSVVSFFKYILTIIGARIRMNGHYKIQLIVNYLKIGRWMINHCFFFRNRVKDREAVFQEVASKIKNEKVLYCEFGVYQGASMQYWSRELTNPSTHLHGFDSFEGLPEDFDTNGSYTKGTFDVGGDNSENPRLKS